MSKINRKGESMNDDESPERTIKALEYNIACKQEMIDKLINDNVELAERVKHLEREASGLREEIVALEWDKRAKVIN